MKTLLTALALLWATPSIAGQPAYCKLLQWAVSVFGQEYVERQAEKRKYSPAQIAKARRECAKS